MAMNEHVSGLSFAVNRDGETLVEAAVQVAFVSGGRARPIPKALRAALKANQDSAGGS